MCDFGTSSIVRGHSAPGIATLSLLDRQKSEMCCFKAMNYQKVLDFNISHIFTLCSKFVTNIWTRLF